MKYSYKKSNKNYIQKHVARSKRTSLINPIIKNLSITFLLLIAMLGVSYAADGHLGTNLWTVDNIDVAIDLNTTDLNVSGTATVYNFTDDTGTIIGGDGTGWDDWNVTELYSTTVYEAGVALTSIYCSLAGCTMAGDIAMGGNDVTGAGDVNATNLNATGTVKGTTGTFDNLGSHGLV